MTVKNLPISTPVVILMSLAMFGCGSDEDPIPRKPEPTVDFSKDDLVGYWNVVSINDNLSLAFVHAYEPPEVEPDTDDGVASVINPDVSHEADEHEIEIDNFYFDFTSDNLWTLKVQFTTILMLMVEDEQMPLPDIGEGEVSTGGYMLSGAAEITGTWSGTYSIIEGAVLSLIRKEKALNITPVNKGAFEKELRHRHIEVRNQLLKKFMEHILTPFGRAYITLEGEMLNLQAPGARAKMVLERQ